MADTLGGVAIGAVLAVLGNWALKYAGPRSRLVYWSGQGSFYLIPQPGQANALSIMTSIYTVQNLGRRSGSTIEVVYSAQPTQVKMTPPLTYTEHAGPQGQHVLVISSLAHKEAVTVEALGLGVAPFVVSVRSADGPAQSVPIVFQRVQPRWITIGLEVLVLTGGGFFIYWILRGLQILAKALGLL